MKTSGYAVGLALLTAAVGATAQEAPPEVPKEEKKICQTERVTGSLTRSKRVCLTRAEWDRLARATKQDIEDLQRNSGAIQRQSGSGAMSGVLGSN